MEYKGTPTLVGTSGAEDLGGEGGVAPMEQIGGSWINHNFHFSDAGSKRHMHHIPNILTYIIEQ